MESASKSQKYNKQGKKKTITENLKKIMAKEEIYIFLAKKLQKKGTVAEDQMPAKSH